MWIFLKAQLSSLTATLVDFMATFLLVEIGRQHYIIATIIGAILGAITNFIINRYWSFGAKKEPVKKQSLRYSLVWTGSITLNVSGVYLLTHFLNTPYMASKIITALFVGIGFNYTLQKHYVFQADEDIITK